MIIREAWYGAALATGEKVFQVPHQPLLTDRGAVLLPPDEAWGLQFLCITQGKFAGLAHDVPGRIWEWDGAWQNRSALFISGRCAYVNGDLQDMAPAGIGYVDDAGQPVSRLVSYETKHDLNSWTERGGLFIGQHHEFGGVVVWDGAHHRVLDSGPCNEIVVSPLVGESTAITYRKDKDLERDNDNTGGIKSKVWTLSELRSLPILGVPPPPPTEPPIMPTFENHIDVVERERAKYGASIGDAEGFAITNAVALDPAVKAEGWGLTKAPAGGHGYVVNGQNYRVDKLCHPQGFINDILGSSGLGLFTPQWSPSADANGNPSNWAPAIGDVPPPPPPPPPSDDLAQVKASIAAISGRVDSMQAQLVGIRAELLTAAEGFRALADRISAIENHPAPIPKLRIVTAADAPELSTGSRFGHSHSIRLKVVAE